MTPNQIRAIRSWLGLNQQEFADRLNVSRNTVARWETGTRNPGGPAIVLLNQMWERLQAERTEEPRGKVAAA